MRSVSPAVRKAALAKARKYQAQIDAANAIKTIRTGAGVDQVELAKLMNVKQPAISRLERQNDIKLSTLQALVSALGGTMDIRVRLPQRAKPLIIGAGK